MDRTSIIALAYLVASVLFILGLKGLTHPRTAVRGNLLGATAMLVAILATLIHQDVISYTFIIVGLVIGGLIGAVLAVNLVLAATQPKAHEIMAAAGWSAPVVDASLVAAFLAGLIGAVTFWGSLLAFCKLREYKKFKKPWVFPGMQALNVGLAVLCVGLLAGSLVCPSPLGVFWTLVIVSSVLGWFLVNPIGGADMPVGIALLNSYSGLAACATGFVMSNSVLIIAGAPGGGAGRVPTKIMWQGVEPRACTERVGCHGRRGVRWPGQGNFRRGSGHAVR